MAVKKLENKEIVLKNMSDCDFSFRPFNTSGFVNVPTLARGMYSGFSIKAELLKNSLMSDIGLQNAFRLGILDFEDNEIKEYLMLPISKNPLHKTYEEIVELINGDTNKLEKYLNEIVDEDNAEECKVMVDLVLKAAIDMKLNNIDKAKLIEDYTGMLLTETLESIRDEEDGAKEDRKSTKKTNKKGTGFDK